MAGRRESTRDPRQPVAKYLPFAPAKYKLRPDFKTFFEKN
jgi:hypothetical protein